MKLSMSESVLSMKRVEVLTRAKKKAVGSCLAGEATPDLNNLQSSSKMKKKLGNRRTSKVD